MVALMTRQFMENMILEIGIDILLNLLSGAYKLEIARQIACEVVHLFHWCNVLVAKTSLKPFADLITSLMLENSPTDSSLRNDLLVLVSTLLDIRPPNINTLRECGLMSFMVGSLANILTYPWSHDINDYYSLMLTCTMKMCVEVSDPIEVRQTADSRLL
jgi:hypothetical protein